MDIKKYALGVDIGGTKIFIMMATQFGEVIYKKKVESTGDLSKIANIIDAFIDESKIERDQIFQGCFLQWQRNMPELMKGQWI